MHNKNIFWGLNKKTKKLIHIFDAQRGIACDCICPICGTALVAHKGRKNAYHFQHLNIDTCTHAAETVLHLKAKEIISDTKLLKIPALVAKQELDELSESIIITEEKLCELENVKEEIIFGKIVPDLIVSYKKTELLVEIAVTHFIDQDKKRRISEQGVSCLEIDLSHLHKDNQIISDKELIEAVVYQTNNKKWIYNKRYLHAKQLANERITERVLKKRMERNERISNYRKTLKERITETLKSNPKIEIDLEASNYYQSDSNIVHFELYGLLQSYLLVQESRISLPAIKFITNIDVCMDTNLIYFDSFNIDDVDIRLKNLENFIEVKLMKLSKGRVYKWLSQNTTMNSDY